MIATLTPCPLPVMFSKLDGLTLFLAPLSPAPLAAASARVAWTWASARDAAKASPESAMSLGWGLIPIGQGRSAGDLRLGYRQ